MKRIPTDAWRQATLALMRYKENKKEIQNRIDIATSKDPEKDSTGSKPLTSDPTAAAAFRLENDMVYQRLKREIRAVSAAVSGLQPEEMKVIEKRFMAHRKGKRTVTPYRYINACYSERQMHRIVQKTVETVAKNLGEM